MEDILHHLGWKNIVNTGVMFFSICLFPSRVVMFPHVSGLSPSDSIPRCWNPHPTLWTKQGQVLPRNKNQKKLLLKKAWQVGLLDVLLWRESKKSWLNLRRITKLPKTTFFCPNLIGQPWKCIFSHSNSILSVMFASHSQVPTPNGLRCFRNLLEDPQTLASLVPRNHLSRDEFRFKKHEFQAYRSFHNHGSEKCVPPIVVYLSKAAIFHFHDYGRMKTSKERTWKSTKYLIQL